MNRYYTISIKTLGGWLPMYRSTDKKNATGVKSKLGLSAVMIEIVTTRLYPTGDLLKIATDLEVTNNAI